jgi:hypothetical protein
MAYVHGRLTVVKVATKDISPYCKTSTLEITPDVHETTGYGVANKTKAGGLIDGKFSVSGTYDNTASLGPGNSIRPLVGTTAAIIRQMEGTGTGKPQDAFNAVVGKYVETDPVDDMVTWSCDFEITGAVNTTPQ